MVAVHAELGPLDSGGVAALFARELKAMNAGHQIVANLMKPLPAGGMSTSFLADVQLFMLSHCALSMQIVAEDTSSHSNRAGFGYADAAAVVMWNEHMERAELLLQAGANQRRTEIGLVAMNGVRMPKAVAG